MSIDIKIGPFLRLGNKDLLLVIMIGYYNVASGCIDNNVRL